MKPIENFQLQITKMKLSSSLHLGVVNGSIKKKGFIETHKSQMSTLQGSGM